MSSRHSLRGGAGLALLTGLVLASIAPAQNCDCQKDCCPPYFKYRFEGAPKIKFKHGCPKPICDPCHLPHYGYYQTCWAPWPFPPDWTHCPVPPPAALVQPIPPKRFRGEPATDDKERDGDKDKDRDREPAAAPAPRRHEGAAMPQFLPSPAATATMPTPAPAPVSEHATMSAPDTPAAIVPNALPVGPVSQTVSHEGHSEPAHTEPAPVPLQPVPPVPEVVKPVEKHEETPVIAPMVYKAPEPPAQLPVEPPARLPTSLAARVTEPAPIDTPRPQTVAANGAAPAMRLVNSRRILLDYDLKDVSAPELSLLELWYTQDSRHWYKDQTSVKSGAPYVVEVNKEGTYGFMMVARNPSEKSVPPAPGEAPQVWVEVDWTKPVVNLVDVKAGTGPMGRSASIIWTATDTNLTQKPVSLSYAEKAEGPWKTFAASLENTGRYTWQVPSTVPANVFVRVEAFDQVGNIGSAQTPLPVQMP